jgi:hypothetical protein
LHRQSRHSPGDWDRGAILRESTADENEQIKEAGENLADHLEFSMTTQ